MKPFKYHQLSSAEALPALLEGCQDPKFVAGGMTLLPTMKLGLIAPTDLIDVSRVPGTRSIDVTGGRIRIGAGVTHAVIAENADLRQHCPGLCQVASTIGDRHVRNRGTIGGSLANNDPAADYPAAIMALDAEICTSGRRIEASEFFLGLFETALESNELITAIEFSPPAAAAYEKFAHPASGFALAGVFVAQTAAGHRVAVTGASSAGVFRLKAAEAVLDSGQALEALASLAFGSQEFFDDRYGSRAYRENLVRVLTRRAVVRMRAEGDRT